MNIKAGLLAGLVLATGAAPVYAESMDQRLQKYEKQLQELNQKLETLEGKKLKKYRKEIQKNKKRTAKLRRMIRANERLKMYGYITAAGAMATNNLKGRYLTSDKLTFNGDARAGLQFNADLTDKLHSVVQIAARSNNQIEWNVAVEWAYLGYDITENLTFRAGRLRVPFYLYSESLQVGFSYPWARAPLDMYASPITALESLDLTYSFDIGEVNNRLQFWASGTADQNESDGNTIALEDIYNLNLTTTYGPITTRLSYTHLIMDGVIVRRQNYPFPRTAIPAVAAQAGGTATCTEDFPVSATNCMNWEMRLNANDSLDYYSAAFRYDDGKYFMISEGSIFKASKGDFARQSDSGYVTFGMRYKNYTPYFGHGWRYSTDDNDLIRKTLPDFKSKSATLGLRYALTNNSAVTFQAQRFFEIQGPGNFSAEAIEPGKTDLDNTNVYTLTFDAVY